MSPLDTPLIAVRVKTSLPNAVAVKVNRVFACGGGGSIVTSRSPNCTLTRSSGLVLAAENARMYRLLRWRRWFALLCRRYHPNRDCRVRVRDNYTVSDIIWRTHWASGRWLPSVGDAKRKEGYQYHTGLACKWYLLGLRDQPAPKTQGSVPSVKVKPIAGVESSLTPSKASNNAWSYLRLPVDCMDK